MAYAQQIVNLPDTSDLRCFPYALEKKPDAFGFTAGSLGGEESQVLFSWSFTISVNRTKLCENSSTFNTSCLGVKTRFSVLEHRINFQESWCCSCISELCLVGKSDSYMPTLPGLSRSQHAEVILTPAVLSPGHSDNRRTGRHATIGGGTRPEPK